MGHGPSGIGKEFSADKILRIKRYTAPCDAVMTSWGTRHLRFPCTHWAFIDSRVTPTKTELQESKCITRKALCDEWNSLYRQVRTPYIRVPETVLCPSSTEGLGHNHLSAGFHAILYACDIWRPKEILLVGFDNVLSGEFTWSTTRGPEYPNYPDHRWDIEHQMLSLVAERFNVELHA